MSRETDLDFDLPPDGMLPAEAHDLGLHVVMCGRRFRALRLALDRGHDTFAVLDARMQRLERVGIAVAAVLVAGELGVTALLKGGVMALARLVGG